MRTTETDATKDFTQAAALDPPLAMAYWGVALARGPDLNTPITQERFDDAGNAARKAVALDAGASERERRFITIMALRYQGKFADWASDNAAYRQAMSAFAHRRRMKTRSFWQPKHCWKGVG